jgi:leader peptidase (prepilin peptidase)/N-methyltransferase
MPFDPLYAVSFFFFGLAFGSFLNVCIHRLPREMSVVRPGSACPACQAPIAWYDNLPVVSWLMLRGRCRACKARISPRYLVVELLTGLLFFACYVGFGWTFLAFKFCAFAFLLVGLIFTDAEHKLLPDLLTLPGLVIGMGFSLLVPVQDLGSRLLAAWVQLRVSSDISWRLLSLVDSGLGAAVGASFIYGAGAIYRRARGVEGMGFGDVKLMAMVGSFLGVKLTIFTLFAASLAGSIFGLAAVLAVWWKRTRRRIVRLHEPATAARKRAWKSARMVYRYYEMPFGVFLGSMALLAAFFGNTLISWYWGLYR